MVNKIFLLPQSTKYLYFTLNNLKISDICLDHKTCVLSEQKLYTQPGLEKHTKKGDFDEDGNVYFFHPYCNVIFLINQRKTEAMIYIKIIVLLEKLL